MKTREKKNKKSTRMLSKLLAMMVLVVTVVAIVIMSFVGKEEVEEIEAVGTIETAVVETYYFSYNDRTDTFIVPETGYYRLKVWGSRSFSDEYLEGSKGGYSEGKVFLNQGTVLYVTAGGIGTNGGGKGRRKAGIVTGAGGGATDIRVGGTSLYHRMIVAGGGSGGWHSARGATGSMTILKGYAGGGVEGLGYESQYCGTQTRAGTGGSFGKGANAPDKYYAPGGGGGGWYGGGTGEGRGAGNAQDGRRKVIISGGGSGYVLTADSYKPAGYAVGSEYYMTETKMETGVNGDLGKAQIEFLGKVQIYSEEKEIKVPRGGTYQLDVNKMHLQIGEVINIVEGSNLKVTTMNGTIATVSGLTITGKAIGETKIKVQDTVTRMECIIYVKVVENYGESIAEGKGYRVIKKRDGTVWSVGQNNAGQLGVRRQYK